MALCLHVLHDNLGTLEILLVDTGREVAAWQKK